MSPEYVLMRCTGHGIAVTSPSYAAHVEFASAEATDPMQRPYLEVTYEETTTCPATAPKKTVSVSLINVPIFLNRFADVVPEGRMYVLDENIDEARQTFARAADPNDQKD